MISVIVPCFNEKNTIEEIVYRIQSQNFIKTQIIIVDDGSTDGTREILRNKIEKKVSKIIYNNTNNGKGYAIRCALPFADKEIIFYKDIDDLSLKLRKFKRDKLQGKKIAKAGKKKYLKYFNSEIVADFLLSKTFDYKSKKKFLWD